MTKRAKILTIGGLILIGQLIIFRDYISPFQWGQIKFSGLACTCPDGTVDKGRIYLKIITPDSLKKYHLDYSEIYLTEKPFTDIDPMGVDQYIITGQIIGKDRVSEEDHWNPKMKVDKWRKVDFLKNLGVKGLFGFELLIFVIIIIKNKKTGA